MRASIKGFILLILFSSGEITAQESFTLQQAINYAEQNSIQNRVNAIDIEDAQQQIRETTAIGIPKVNASFGYNYNYLIPKLVIPDFADPSRTQELQFGLPHNAVGNIEVSTLLLDGQYIYGLRAARTYKALVNSQTVSANRDVRYNVAKAYLGAWLVERNLIIVERNIENLRGNLEDTKVIQENGFAEQLDVDRLDLSMRTLRTEYENLKRMAAIALNNLKFLMNYPIDQEIIIADDFDALVNQARVMKVDLAQAIDISRRPEYLTFQTSEEINEINVKRLKAGYFPNLVAFANYQANLSRNKLFDGDEPGFLGAGAVGLQLNVPIFDGFEKSAQIQIAKLNIDLIQTRKSEFEQAANMEARNAKIQLYNSQQTLQNRQENLDLAQRIYDVTQIKYKEGVGSSIETSTAERELYLVQADVLSAQFDLLNAKIDLDKAQGNF